MEIGAVTTKRFSKSEIIKLINDTFKDCDNLTTVCVVTEISEYKGDKVQSFMFAKNMDI